MKFSLREWIRAAVVGLLLLAWFVKYTVISSFDVIPGNIGDARFLLYLCEHWYQVFTGRADWLSPGMFYPQAGALGFSDSLFLFGIVYSFLRKAGLDPYAAYQVIVIALPFLGFVGAWVMLRYWFGFVPLASLLGAALFGYSSALYTSMAHAQLEAAALLPVLAILLAYYLSWLGNRDQAANLSGLTFCVLFPLLAYTSFYTAWFLVLWLSVAATLGLVWILIGGHQALVAIWLRKVAQCWINISANLCVAAIFSVPFLLTYVPVLRLFSRRPFPEIVPMLPGPIDLVNVGFENFAWGRLLQTLDPFLQTRPSFWELDKGVSFLVLLTFTCGSLLSLKRVHDPQRSTADVLVLICALTVWSGWLLMLKVEGHSMWWVIYRFFPGAGAVRAVYRFNISLMLPVAVVIAFVVHHCVMFFKRRTSRLGVSVLAVLALAMVVEQGNAHRDVFSKSVERTFMASVPPAPGSCRSMVMVADQDTHMGWWAPLQIDAMLIAQANHIPTVNGYSGWTPDGWALHMPTEHGYKERVHDWIMGQNVPNGLCSFQYETRKWAPFKS
jgi:hypothetical protein